MQCLVNVVPCSQESALWVVAQLGVVAVAFRAVLCCAVQVPLVTLVGASNELPESEELDALYDRFLLRKEVKQVSVAGGLNLMCTLAGWTVWATDFQSRCWRKRACLECTRVVHRERVTRKTTAHMGQFGMVQQPKAGKIQAS